jgi:hypothetical protein
MAITPISAVYLDSVQFTTDPLVYTRNWVKRTSAHVTIGGVTIQDFGLKAKDNVLQLESGGNYMAEDVVNLIDAKYAALGLTYPFVDFNGTEATVFITEFTPVDTFYRQLYEYRMTLRVVTLTKLRGVAYVET